MRRATRRAKKAAPFKLANTPFLFDLFDPVNYTPSSWPSQVGSSIFTDPTGHPPNLLTNRINGLGALQFQSTQSHRLDVFRNWGMASSTEWTWIAVMSITGFGQSTPAYIYGSFDTLTNVQAFALATDGNGLGHPTLRRNPSGATGVEWLVDLVGTGYHIVAGRASSDGTCEIFVDGISRGTFSDTSAPCKNSLTLGCNGAAANEFADFELAYLINCNGRLSATQMQQVHAALRSKFGLAAPNQQCNIRGYGHSIVAGGDATRIGTTDFMSRIEHRLDPFTFTMSHLGHSGFDTSQLLPLAAADVDAFLVPGKLNIFVYMEMVNSIDHQNGAGVPPAQIVSNTVSWIQSMFTARRAAGWDKCIFVNMYYPIYYDSNPTLMGVLDQITSQLLAWSGIDQTIDIYHDPEINKFPGDTRIISSTDNLHLTDYGHQCTADLGVGTIQNVYAAATAVTLPWDPSLLKARIALRFEAAASKILFDNGLNVGTFQDKSTWAYDVTASGAARPIWDPTNGTVDGAGAALMSMTLALALTYTSRIEVFLQASIGSASTVLFEMSGNYTGVQDSFALLSTASDGPELAANGNVGASNGSASAASGLQKWSLILDNTLSTGQVQVLLNGASAPGYAHVDAPNTNVLGSRQAFLFGRSGGSLQSTANIRRLIIFGRPLTSAERAQLLAWAT